jgi:ABC-type transporter Mla subunit MlaD
VELDEVLRTFDAPTRAAFRSWLQSQANAIDGRGVDVNAALGSLPGFVESADGLLATLDSQSSAVRRLVSSTGEFFGAISAREGQLRGLISDADRLFQTTAGRNQDLAGIFRELPRFEREATLTLPRLSAFARRARPVVKQLQPAATEADPLFADFARLSPQFDGFFERLDEVVAASKPGLPAFNRILGDVPSLLQEFQPFLRNANPVLDYVGDNKREVTAFFANVASASQIHDQKSERTTKEVHFLRTAQTLGPTAMSFYPRPLGSTRLNPYVAPSGMTKLATGLPVLDKTFCTNGDPLPPVSSGPGSLAELVTTYGIRTTGRDAARPACVEQSQIPGFTTQFPQLKVAP